MKSDKASKPNSVLLVKDAVRLSKLLSLVLRHQPEKLGIEIDAQGYTDVEILLYKMQSAGWQIDREILDEVVSTNNKQRFAYDSTGTKIRASQGHSLHVDLKYEPVIPPAVLYHGTGEKSLASILANGLSKRSRQHVHLCADIKTAIQVGKRHGPPVVLIVQAKRMHENGYRFYLSDNGVWLTDFVGPEHLSILEET
ncbi:MAG: RNA 2'-phosphotransferase [Erysipelotrichaceae bacterium]|jgi:putative RNA 2'-phosphotransferase|nr:RNA 2'-phosphotransferase [Erysipelotrichaceae bacterium]